MNNLLKKLIILIISIVCLSKVSFSQKVYDNVEVKIGDPLENVKWNWST